MHILHIALCIMGGMKTDEPKVSRESYYEYSSKEELIAIVLQKDKKYSTLSQKFDKQETSRKISTRLVEAEKQLDTAADWIYSLEKRIAEINGTERPSYLMILDSLLDVKPVEK